MDVQHLSTNQQAVQSAFGSAVGQIVNLSSRGQFIKLSYNGAAEGQFTKLSYRVPV
jgi:hypothetical protein